MHGALRAAFVPYGRYTAKTAVALSLIALD